MKITYFKHAYKNGKEVNISLLGFSLRIATKQFALWTPNFKSIFNFK